MKRLLVLCIIVSLAALFLTACGGPSKVRSAFEESLSLIKSTAGSEASEESEEAAPAVEIAQEETRSLAGMYHSVAAEASGVTITGELIDGISFDLKEDGTAVIWVDGDSGEGTYTVEGDTITILLEGEEMIGTIGEDILVFENLMSSGVRLTLAKEGTAAAETDYSTEEDTITGVWQSVGVTDILGNEVTNIPADSCKAEFSSDKTATIRIGDRTFGPSAYLDFEGMFLFDAELNLGDLSVMWLYSPYGLQIIYSSEEGQYLFTMKKQSVE